MSSSKLTPLMLADNRNLLISNSIQYIARKSFFETMNEQLGKVANWFKTIKLPWNISKTKYSLFYSTRKRI